MSKFDIVIFTFFFFFGLSSVNVNEVVWCEFI